MSRINKSKRYFLIPLGHYADSDGASSCTICPAGSECSDATLSPVQCLAGTYSASGAVVCTACATGITSPNFASHNSLHPLIDNVYDPQFISDMQVH